MMKNVCIFGSGMVSKPAVEFFAQKDDFNITLASKFTKDLDDVAGNIPGVRKVVIDAKDEAGVRKLLKDQDVVISLLPVMLHPKIATAAIATKTHFVSTSYVTKEMGLLSDNAKAAGIILLNECGLDPGLDHMSTMSLVNKLKSEGKTITSYESYGTGLPAPEYNDKPWGYKFSWSPKGVIEATRYGAIYKKDGQKIQFLPGTIFEYAWQVDIPEVDLKRIRTGMPQDTSRFMAWIKLPLWSEALCGTWVGANCGRPFINWDCSAKLTLTIPPKLTMSCFTALPITALMAQDISS